MTSVSTASIAIQASNIDIQDAKRQRDSAQAGSFDALFAMFNVEKSSNSKAASVSSSAGVGEGNNSVGGIFDVFLAENSAASSAESFGFSSDFTSAFGNGGGPLFDWVNMVTSALHLTSEQNAALQKIAVGHKDTAGSSGDVQSIAAELAAAGIA